MTFNKVVFRHTGVDERNIHIAVHPFQCDADRKMEQKGDHGSLGARPLPELPSWQAHLADALWDGVPGLARIFFDNGKIILQHQGVFPDTEILAAAKDIITPALEQQLGLSQMWVDTPGEPDERYQERSDTEGQEF